MRIDPRKAAIVLILVYGGLLLWILPPFEDLRWTDEVAAQETAQAADSPTATAGAKGQRAADGPGASTDSGEVAAAVTEREAQARPVRKRGATPKVASKEASPEPAVATKPAPPENTGQRTTRAQAVSSASLAIRALPADGESEAGLVRVEVLGGARAERALATWLRGLGGPPVETDLFGSVGIPIEAQSEVSVRVPPGLALRVTCQLGARAQTQKVKALARDASREIALEFGAALGDQAVARAEPGAGMLAGVAAVEASAVALDEPAVDALEAPVQACEPTADEAADAPIDSREGDAPLPDKLPESSADAPTTDAPSIPVYREATSSARVRGFLLDQDGEGVASMSIWLVIPWGAADRNPRRLRFEDRVRAEVQTAEDGSFAFAEVPDGAWLVGVAPAGTARAPVNATDISRIARSVKLKR
ncbi:MAG: hypothetical protein ACI80N_004292, partial [Gammaproteobacteria bacterium]